MIRSPLGLRLSPTPGASPRDQVREAAKVGARGVLLDAIGDLGPDRLSETGRRDLRQVLRSTELALIGLALPTRRAFDNEDQIDDRLARAGRAFTLAYDLGTRLVVAKVGAVPPAEEPSRREVFTRALDALARLADHHGVRLAMEVDAEPGAVVRAFLDERAVPGLAASVCPSGLLSRGIDPALAVVELGPWLAHAYASDARGSAAGANPRGFGYAPGALDWPSYLGSLEEVDYRGFLTVWPDAAHDVAGAFARVAESIKRF